MTDIANALADATADFTDSRIAKAFGTSLNSTTPAASAEIPTGAITPTILARALIRCVDSRIAAITGNSADAGDFDIRKYDSTGILIYSTDSAGNLHEKPVHYVNPDSTNAQLVTLGKSLIALTNDTYQATYRVTKTLCDTPDYSQYLVVDSPFTQDFSDNCGIVWTPTGTVSVEDGHAVLTSGYLQADQDITLGGQDFAASFVARANSNSNAWCGICAAYGSNIANGNGFSFYRYINTSTIRINVIDYTGTTLLNAFELPNALNAEHHFEIDYTHDDTTLRVFLDGSLVKSVVGEFKRGQHRPAIGLNNTNAGLRTNGYIANFQIYDGAALHTEDCTPE